MIVEKLTIKDTFRIWRDKINYLIDKIANIPATEDNGNYELSETTIGAKSVVIDIPLYVNSPDSIINGYLDGNAKTASTLKAPVKINGTEFDGSTEIKTENWGALRNIRISDAKGENFGNLVQIDGSDDYILTLPSTIKADIDGNVVSNEVLSKFVSINGIKFNGSEDVINYGVCSTNSNVAIKEVTLVSPDFILSQGSFVTVKFLNKNTTTEALYLNVNETGSKPILNKGVPVEPTTIVKDSVFTFVYDNEAYNMICADSIDNKVYQSVSNENEEYPLLASPITDSSVGSKSEESLFTQSITINPSTGSLTVTNINSNGNIKGTNITVSDTLTATKVNVTEDIETTNIVASNYITGTNITASDTLTADSIISNGNIKGTSLTIDSITSNTITSSGDISGTNIIATGTISGSLLTINDSITSNTITSSGNISGTNITASDTLTAENIIANVSISGDSLAVNSYTVTTTNATVSDTLTADSIVSNNIEGTSLTIDSITSNTITSSGDISGTNIIANAMLTAEDITSTKSLTTPTIVSSSKDEDGVSTLSVESNIDCFEYEITANKLYGVGSNTYADYFERGEETEDGDIIALDVSSTKESYVKATKDSLLIIGVHSDTYGCILGGTTDDIIEGQDDDPIIHFIPVGLKGRVNVKFKGKSQLGEAVVPSETPGVGCLYDSSVNTERQIIGYIVEDSSETEELRKVKIFLK